MPSKSASIYNKAFDNAVMTGTDALTSVVTGIIYRDSVSYQFVWTGTPTGTFSLQGSNDYNPGTPQSGGVQDGPANSGTWTAIALSSTPAASGSAGNALVNLNQLGFAFIRAVYTNASGTGVLNGTVVTKSLGI